MAQRPTVEDLAAWSGLVETPPPTSAEYGVLNDVLQASISEVERRITLPADADTNYPQPVRVAVQLVASRLVKRRTSPEGVAGFGDLGVVRILADDPQVEGLLQPYLRLDGFA